MRLASLPFLAVPLCTFALFACSATSSDDATIGGEESNYTSEAGADGGTDPDASAAEASAPAAPIEVSPFTLADVTTEPKLRFSYDGAPGVDALQTEWTTVISGADRRFQLKGASPAPGNPVFYMEFGHGAALIQKTTYDCADFGAVVLIIDKDEVHNLTVVDGPPARSRPCKVVIDELQELPKLRPSEKTTWNVVGRVEAEVAPRDDANAPGRHVRAAFAAFVFDSSQ